MKVLQFPNFQFQTREVEGKIWIYDSYRKKEIILTPEEWVRQHVLAFLCQVQKYPAALISVERSLTFNQLKKRFDVLVYSSAGKPFMLVECKAPEVKLSSETLFQIATYNMVFQVPFLFVSNGMQHLLFELKDGKYQSIQSFPEPQ
jgi:type I site-specific restriction endonuclease